MTKTDRVVGIMKRVIPYKDLRLKANLSNMFALFSGGYKMCFKSKTDTRN